jgi:hypothetical protein
MRLAFFHASRFERILSITSQVEVVMAVNQ